MLPLFSFRCKNISFIRKNDLCHAVLFCKQSTTYFLDWKGSNIDGISLMKDLPRNKEDHNIAHACCFIPFKDKIMISNN